MGIYPVNVGSGNYTLTAPLFEKVTLHLENGNDIRIEARNLENKDEALNVFISEMEINNKRWNENFLNYGDLLDGARIEFMMHTKPNYNRAALNK